MPTLQRTVKTPKSYDFQPLGRATLLDKIYVGFVKAVNDVQRMGRLKVWIPEIGGDPNDENSWLTCSYASPFAGATNVFANTAGNQWQDSQRSYGMWFVPPDVENEVLCCFINGDPGRGVWFACMYQQFMNNMVPGLPGDNGTNKLPVGEYNKLKTNEDTTNPQRPTYAPLADQLATQGLDNDPLRGTSSSGARRSKPANSVYGFLTPGGSQIVFDDNPESKLIRLRTQYGAQILVSDTDGCIYMNSRDGNNWLQMSASGEIDIYANNDVSIRSQGNLNFRADLDINLEAGRSIFIKARNDPDTPLGEFGGGLIKMNANVAMHLSSNGDFYASAMNNFNRTAQGDILDTAKGDCDYKAGSSVYIQADGGDVDIKARAEIHETATNIHLNSIQAGDASAASKAEQPQDLQMQDNKVTGDGQISSIMRNTILYRLPYHEPYAAHAGSFSGANGHVSATDPETDPDLQLVRKGEVLSNQATPNDILGSPRRGMKPGKYSGQGYDDNGNPIYKYEGGSADLVQVGSLKISDAGIEFIKRAEGYRKTVYKDVVGLKTVGVGHLLKKDELAGNYVNLGGQRVYLDRALTDAEVNALLHQDLQTYEQAVRNSVRVKLTQSQYDMLVSLCFNIGTGAFSKSTLVRNLNAGDFESAPAGFMMWCKAGGRTVKGLVNRRRQEASNFRTGSPTNAG